MVPIGVDDRRGRPLDESMNNSDWFRLVASRICPGGAGDCQMRCKHGFGIVAAIAFLAYAWQQGNTEHAPTGGAADRGFETPSSPRSSALAIDPEAEPRDAPLVRDFVSSAKAGPEAPELPAWLSRALPGIDSSAGEVTTNDRSRNEPLRSIALNPLHLAVLQDIIDLNGLDEGSAAFDYDDGDGTLSPTELGFQVWRNGQLVSLTLGRDPYSSFGYGVTALPESLADFDQLDNLDVQGNLGDERSRVDRTSISSRSRGGHVYSPRTAKQDPVGVLLQRLAAQLQQHGTSRFELTSRQRRFERAIGPPEEVAHPLVLQRLLGVAHLLCVGAQKSRPSEKRRNAQEEPRSRLARG